MPYKRYAANVLIVAIAGLFLIDGLPVFSETHRAAKRAVHPVLSRAGLWQGSWQLFAPEPQKSTTRLSARIEYEGGRSCYWQSPDWSKMSPVERFGTFRMQEYVDYLGNSENAAAWPALANYLARNVRHPERPEARALTVTISAEYARTPPPADAENQAPPGPVAYDRFETLCVRGYGK